MFHYIDSKQELFLTLCDDGLALIRQEYLARVDMEERDILERLRQVFNAKINLMSRYPWIFEFFKAVSLVKSGALDREMGTQIRRLQNESAELLFGNIDVSNFRNELDTERSKQLVPQHRHRLRRGDKGPKKIPSSGHIGTGYKGGQTMNFLCSSFVGVQNGRLLLN